MNESQETPPGARGFISKIAKRIPSFADRLKGRKPSAAPPDNPLHPPTVEAEKPSPAPVETPKKERTREEKETDRIKYHENMVDRFEKHLTDEQIIKRNGYLQLDESDFPDLSSPELLQEARAYAEKCAGAIKGQPMQSNMYYFLKYRLREIITYEYILAHDTSLKPEWKAVHDREIGLLNTVNTRFMTNHHITPDPQIDSLPLPEDMSFGDNLRTIIRSAQLNNDFEPYSTAEKQLTKPTENLDTREKEKFEDNRMRELQEMSAIHILNATNTVRRTIQSGDMDTLDSERAYRTIHRTHIGNSPESAMIALASDENHLSNFKGLGWELDQDMSFYSDEAYRLHEVEWSEIRGIMGVPPNDLPDFARKLFGGIDQVIASAKNQPFPDEAVRAAAICYGTLVDLAHVKVDCNGRSSEDFTIWLQRVLSQGKLPPVFLSQNGLRARSAEKFAQESIKPQIEQQRKRIDARGDFVMNIRHALYQEMVKIVDEQPEEKRLAEKIGYGDYFRTSKPKDVTKLFYQLLNVGQQWIDGKVTGKPFQSSSSFEQKITDQFEALLTYFQQNAVSEYTALNPNDAISV